MSAHTRAWKQRDSIERLRSLWARSSLHWTDTRRWVSMGSNSKTGSNNWSSSSYQAVCKNNPLKIENYPDYDKLSDEDEKEFCRVARVQPAVFLRVKSILLLECSKAGFCSYSRARKIAGIDVNKTRLIHNLLVNNATIKASAWIIFCWNLWPFFSVKKLFIVIHFVI